MLILLFGFLVFQFYSASIVGSLLMEKPKTIKTLRNLIDSSLDVGIEDIVYNKDFFKVSTLLVSGMCCCIISISSSFIRSYATNCWAQFPTIEATNKAEKKKTRKKNLILLKVFVHVLIIYIGEHLHLVSLSFEYIQFVRAAMP